VVESVPASAPSRVLYDVAPAWVASLATGQARLAAPVALGLNLALDDPGNAVSLVRAVRSRLRPPGVVSLEIGNEPDLFTHARTFRVGWLTVHRPRRATGGPWCVGLGEPLDRRRDETLSRLVRPYGRKRTVARECGAVVGHLFEESWNKGNSDALEDVVDGAYRSHIDETHPVRTSHWTGPSIVRVEIAAYRSAMPNLNLDVATIIADGDRAAAIWRTSGDNTGDAVVEDGDEVIPASGLAIETTGIGIFAVRDGRIVEATYRWDPLGPLTQMRLFAAGTLEVQVSGETVTMIPQRQR
jgi:ketosteroid isomerase-like protein